MPARRVGGDLVQGVYEIVGGEVRVIALVGHHARGQ